MVVQHNMQAMNSSRMLNITTSQQAKSTEKLSSGYRINRAADDAAGLAISEKMRKQIRGLTQASTNAEDGVSCVQTAEGALNEVQDMIQRMNELAVQAANGTNSESDRTAIQNEIDQLTTEIDRVAETTKFNETYLLKGAVDQSTKTQYLTPYDAGLAGTLGPVCETDPGQPVTFTAKPLVNGEKVIIGGNEYTIGETTNTAANVYSTTDLYSKMEDELKKANKIGLYVDGNLIDSRNAADPTIKNNDDGTFTITPGSLDVIAPLSFDLHAGADADMANKIIVKIDTMDTATLGIKGLDVVGDSEEVPGTTATYAIDAIATALQKVSDQRAALGAVQNRLEHSINNLDNVVENTTAAESRIRDTNMADEMVRYSKNNILAQAGQSMLAQANQSTQGVLSLLQ